MGGLGSGRPPDYSRQTVEDHLPLDVNELNRAGRLHPGGRGIWEWKQDGTVVSRIQIRTMTNYLVLTYSYVDDKNSWKKVDQAVPIVRVPCRFGGTRPYFICPGMVGGAVCGKRVVKLYAPGKYFLCRHCYELSYASQREGEWDRALRRADRMRMRLGGKPGIAAPLPDRPKGMWQRTYARVGAEASAAQAMALWMFQIKADLLLAQLKSRKRRSGR